MSGHPLTGVDPNDPRPGTKAEIRFGQGKGSGAGPQRKVLFLAQRHDDGTETVNTLGNIIADDADCIERFGAKSEIRTMYLAAIAIDPAAEYKAIAIPPGGSATASTRTITFTTNAAAATTLVFEWAGNPVEIPVAQGDTPTVIAAALVVGINNQIDWPISAGAVAGEVTLTVESPLGPRGDFTLAYVRAYFRKSVSTNIALGSVTSGSVDDDQTTALGLIAGKNFYYQVNCKSPTSGPSATDNGIGEHAAQITRIALPNVGIRQQMFWAFTGQSSSVATIATAVNNPRAQMFWAQGTSWTPAMVAAHCTAAIRLKQVAHPAARLTDYGLGANDVFNIPAPVDSADIPLSSEITSALNNGATVINWTDAGQAFFERQITTRSLNGTANDYRVRSGHIPSAMDYAIDYIADQVGSVSKDFVANDPPEGATPLENVTYPKQVRSQIQTAVDDLITFPGGPVLDPSVRDQMLASVDLRRLVNGTSAAMDLEAAKHNDKKHYLVREVSTGV